MRIKVISAGEELIEKEVNGFIMNNKDKEIVDIHFTQNDSSVSAFIIFKVKSLQKLTDEEIKVLKALIFGGLTNKKAISHRFSPSILYTLEKLEEYGVVEFDDEDNLDISAWAKPKFVFEYMLNKEEQSIIMLLKREGELKQIEISAKTRIPRTTISRKLRELEMMNVVERYLDGSSKYIKLSKWFSDNL